MTERYVYALQDQVTKSWAESERFVALGDFKTAKIFISVVEAETAKDTLKTLLTRERAWWDHGRRLTSGMTPELEVVRCKVAPVETSQPKIPAKTKSKTAHNWQSIGLSPHNGEYWYKCTKCGARDWIASYGSEDQLMPAKCDVSR